MKIANKIVSSEFPYIIAEVGSNWATIDHCFSSISLAKQAGASAVKFQAFTHKALYGYEALNTYEHYENFGRYELPLEWIPKLSVKARSCGIDLMVTAFDIETLRYLDPYVSCHKIASSDATYHELLTEALKLNKVVIQSVGGCSRGDISLILKNKEISLDNFILLYCSASYPARFHHLSTIDYLRESFWPNVGYSDHSIDVLYAPSMAIKAHGAIVLEKHVNFVNLSSPDSPHSVSLEEFRRMVELINNEPELMLPTPEEHPFVIRHKRRLVATKDLKIGDKLAKNINYGSYRVKVDDPSGLSCFKSDIINGMTCLKAVKAGEPITPEHL